MYLSLILVLVSRMGSYWNLMRCKWRTGGNLRNITPFLASWGRIEQGGREGERRRREGGREEVKEGTERGREEVK